MAEAAQRLRSALTRRDGDDHHAAYPYVFPMAQLRKELLSEPLLGRQMRCSTPTIDGLRTPLARSERASVILATSRRRPGASAVLHPLSPHGEEVDSVAPRRTYDEDRGV